MLNIVSILIGLVAVLFLIPGLVPFFGLLQYATIAIAVVGLLVGVISSRNTGRNLNIAILVVAVLRLMLGGGFL
jgi:hypothetical protein